MLREADAPQHQSMHRQAALLRKAQISKAHHLVDIGLEEALINAFITSADKHNRFFGCSDSRTRASVRRAPFGAKLKTRPRLPEARTASMSEPEALPS